MSECPICLGLVGPAKTILECGHQFCSRCILNSVANNTGTIDGNTRNLCPLCRGEMCDEIQPDARTTEIETQLRVALSHAESSCDAMKNSLRVLVHNILAPNKRRRMEHYGSVRKTAATIIQRWSLKWLLRRKRLLRDRELWRVLDSLALSIQRIFRGFQVRISVSAALRHEVENCLKCNRLLDYSQQNLVKKKLKKLRKKVRK